MVAQPSPAKRSMCDRSMDRGTGPVEDGAVRICVFRWLEVNAPQNAPYSVLLFINQEKSVVKCRKAGGIENFVVRSSGNMTRLDKVIVNLICCANLPFNLVNNPHFRTLCKPWSEQLKDESHYRKLLPIAYAAVKCTSDIWSGPSQGFISLTAEGITDKWTRVLVLPEKNSRFSYRWWIEHEKEMDNNEKILPFFRANCAAHLLDRSVKNSFGSKQGAISELFANCRRIVSRVKHSIKALDELKEAQELEGLPQHKLLQEMVVRWNSSLIMIRRNCRGGRNANKASYRLHAVSTFLDPRFKVFFAADKDLFTMHVKLWLADEQKDAQNDAVLDIFSCDESDFIAPPSKLQRTFLDSLSEIASTSKTAVQARWTAPSPTIGSEQLFSVARDQELSDWIALEKGISDGAVTCGHDGVCRDSRTSPSDGSTVCSNCKSCTFKNCCNKVFTSELTKCPIPGWRAKGYKGTLPVDITTPKSVTRDVLKPIGAQTAVCRHLRPDICGSDIRGPDICDPTFAAQTFAAQTFAAQTFAARHLRPRHLRPRHLPLYVTKKNIFLFVVAGPHQPQVCGSQISGRKCLDRKCLGRKCLAANVWAANVWAANVGSQRPQVSGTQKSGRKCLDRKCLGRKCRVANVYFVLGRKCLGRKSRVANVWTANVWAANVGPQVSGTQKSGRKCLDRKCLGRKCRVANVYFVLGRKCLGRKSRVANVWTANVWAANVGPQVCGSQISGRKCLDRKCLGRKCLAANVWAANVWAANVWAANVGSRRPQVSGTQKSGRKCLDRKCLGRKCRVANV
uniref:Uncharacterized protein n=1 Tax=Globodera rostochiensis TaxID=31243 RepID=A0A914HN89_GLORO